MLLTQAKLLTDRLFSVRAQKALGLVNGTPDYTDVSGFLVPDVPARIQNYSSDGRLYAYALPTVQVSSSSYALSIHAEYACFSSTFLQGSHIPGRGCSTCTGTFHS